MTDKAPVAKVEGDAPAVIEMNLPDIVKQVIEKGVGLPGIVDAEFSILIAKHPMLSADLAAAQGAIKAKLAALITIENIGNTIQQQMNQILSGKGGKNPNHPGVAG